MRRRGEGKLPALCLHQLRFLDRQAPGGRTFELPEVEELLAKREIGPLQGFISKMGRPFAAILRISDEYKLEFDFGQNDEDDAEAVDFSGHTPVGACPSARRACSSTA